MSIYLSWDKDFISLAKKRIQIMSYNCVLFLKTTTTKKKKKKKKKKNIYYECSLEAPLWLF